MQMKRRDIVYALGTTQEEQQQQNASTTASASTAAASHATTIAAQATSTPNNSMTFLTTSTTVVQSNNGQPQQQYHHQAQYQQHQQHQQQQQQQQQQAKDVTTLDALLSATYCRSQKYLSRQLAQLHPELTMPMFSEVTYRFQTARREVRQLLLQYLLPWLHNMELVDPNVPPCSNPLSYFQFSDEHPKETEELWATLCGCWPNNLKVIIRYLIIVSGMAPIELLPYAKRVVLYLARARPDRLVDEMMSELQTVETLNCLIERTETPPFYRLTSMRKASSHSDAPAADPGNPIKDLTVEKGTIHTKRHSGEDPIKSGSKSEPLRSLSGCYPSNKARNHVGGGANLLSDEGTNPIAESELATEDAYYIRNVPVSFNNNTGRNNKSATTNSCDKPGPMELPQPHPLPMPEYGGYFAPLTEYLPDSSQPISGFHRCNIAVMLLTDVVVDGIQLDWAIHVPLMLHIVFLGLDHSRPLVRDHCRLLLLNMLITLGDHRDHLGVARVLLSTKTELLGLGLTMPPLPVYEHNFTEVDVEFDSYLYGPTTSTTTATSYTQSSTLTQASNSGSVVVSSANRHHSPSRSQSPPPPTSHPSSPFASSPPTPPPLPPPMPSTALVPPTSEASSPTLSSSMSSSSNNPSPAHSPVNNIPRIQSTPPAVSSNDGKNTTSPVLALIIQTCSKSKKHVQDLFKNYNNESLTQVAAANQGGNWSSTSSQRTATTKTAPLPVIVTPEDGANWTSPKPGPNMQIQDEPASVELRGHDRQSLVGAQRRATDHAAASRATSLSGLTAARPGQPAVAQTALQLGLSCSSRHYAGRSLQVFRALKVPITSRMLSDILSRLVETVAEQGEDMQGYVTELLLTLEAAVDSLESDFRPLDFMKEIFKSTPNLNNKDAALAKRSSAGPMGYPNQGPQMYTQLNQPGHMRSTSYSVSYSSRKSAAAATAAVEAKEMEKAGGVMTTNTSLSRSRSAQSLKLLGDSATQDDKMTILAQLFWLSVSLLESDYEHEFLLALRLLDRVLHRLPLDRPDARDKVEKLQQQLKWNTFPGVHALLLKGCTSPNTYEQVVTLLSQFTLLLDLPVVDPTQSLAFPMNVVSLLPYMLLNYEDANELCIRSAENIAQISAEKGKKLENLGTVMTLYSRRTFSKESFQWTKCVVKYLYDTYAHLSFNMLSFLVEVLEKGPANVTVPVLSIIHCMLHYVDITTQAAQPTSVELLRVVSKHVEGESTDNFNWGVRRRPLGEGEERESSLRTLEESLSEKTVSSAKQSLRRGLTEESSDEEVGSESPLEESPSPGQGQETNNLAGIYHLPSSLSLMPERSRNDSFTRSDTSGSSMGDETPCNNSPNLSALMPFRQIRDDVEEIWRQQIQNLSTQPSFKPLETFQLIGKILRDVTSKSISLTRESISLLSSVSGSSVASSQLASHLSSHVELLISRAEAPIVWFSPQAFEGNEGKRLHETLRFGLLEVQEHLDSFLDRKESVNECIESLRAAVKMNALQIASSEAISQQVVVNTVDDSTLEEFKLDLGRALYKLHFQLLMLHEASNKMHVALSSAAKNPTFALLDMSAEIASMRQSLARSLEIDDVESDRGSPERSSSPAPESGSHDELVKIAEYLKAAKWSLALEKIREQRPQWSNDSYHDDDDVTTAVNMFCKYLGQDRAGKQILIHQKDNVIGAVFKEKCVILGVVQLLSLRLSRKGVSGSARILKLACARQQTYGGSSVRAAAWYTTVIYIPPCRDPDSTYYASISNNSNSSDENVL
ncbi:unnamed protein product [Trichogramma brassicae]|uniref:Protein furry n=1 Tax=Trichogramma brassicae TaxID=86971 RepID=A0A6H5I9D0_9HYME|nr:unnamed protein product [Trichogramma brassicae]